MTKIDPAWLEAFDKELLRLFAIDHRDAGMDEYCWAATQTFRRVRLPWRSAATTTWSATMRCGLGRA